MAHVEPALPFDHFSGKLSRKERIVMRTRNGRTHAHAIQNPYTGPLAESRKRAISTFSEAVRLCKTEMSDPDRLAYWQARYIQYRKAANKHVARALGKRVFSVCSFRLLRVASAARFFPCSFPAFSCRSFSQIATVSLTKCRKLADFYLNTCTYQKIVVPLHRKTKVLQY